MDNSVWVMRDGKEISVKSMTTQHIQNCIKMLENNFIQREKWQKQISELAALAQFLLQKELSDNQSKTLDQADNHLMMAEVLLEDTQKFTKGWIETFQAELKLRETN